MAFGDPVPNNYPKSDPYCYSTGQRVTGPPSELARPLCILDWSPYVLNLQAAAQATGAANNGAKTTFNPTLTANTAWTSNGPQVPGKHFIISITDTASAARYGLQSASLSRAGDDGASRAFVAPDAAGLIAGEQAFKPSPVSGVLVPDPSTTAADAYPLTTLTYAATTPETLTPAQRLLYATFLLYAIGDGQTDGRHDGPAAHRGTCRCPERCDSSHWPPSTRSSTRRPSPRPPPPAPRPRPRAPPPDTFGSTDTGTSSLAPDTGPGAQRHRRVRSRCVDRIGRFPTPRSRRRSASSTRRS